MRKSVVGGWWAAAVVVLITGWAVPAWSEPGRVLRDVPYGEAARQRLDLYCAPQAGPRPVVLVFHGGGFERGDKGRVGRSLVAALAERGVSVAAVNYRFAPGDLLPAAMRDGARAVQFLRCHAEALGVDPSAVAVTGSSAGAGIALWIAFHEDLADPGSEDPVARCSSRVSGVWGRDAQVSYTAEFWIGRGLGHVIPPAKRVALFGDPPFGESATARAAEASPLTHLTADDPPVRLDYAASLELGPTTPATALLHHPRHGVALLEACRARGVACTLSYAGGDAPTEPGTDFLLRCLGVDLLPTEGSVDGAEVEIPTRDDAEAGDDSALR